MIRSFSNTASPETKLAIYIDNDDPMLDEYLEHIVNPRVHICNRINVAQAHNWLVNEYPDFDYYMPINDDITFQSNGWDKILTDTIESKGCGWGISYGNDLTGNDKYNLPTFGCMSANIVNTLGYFYPLELKMMFGDTFLLDLGRAIGKLYYCPDVIIKHSPPGFAQEAFVPGDHRMDSSLYKQEQLAYAKYVDNKLDEDVRKIFSALIHSNKKVYA